MIAAAQYCDLSADQAFQIMAEVLSATRQWAEVAKELRIARADIELMRASIYSLALEVNILAILRLSYFLSL